MMMNESPAYLLHRLVFEMDRGADKLLRAHAGISYKRALFLAVLQDYGTMTQHELAAALGYSDPAVSTMLLELVRDGYVRAEPSPEHGRKRLVTLTPEGNEAVTKGRRLLDSHFERIMLDAGVDVQHYSDLTRRLYQAMTATMKKENL